MRQEEIITILKESYPRDIRKQLVKSILEVEKEEADLSLQKPYQTINKIFSYVLQESDWKMGENSTEWNTTPLKIMEESFPKLSRTKWYKEQILHTRQDIEIVTKDS